MKTDDKNKILHHSDCFQSFHFLMAPVVKNLLAIAGTEADVGLIPVLRRSPGGGNGYSLWYSCLENSIDRGVWWATVHGAAKSWI